MNLTVHNSTYCQILETNYVLPNVIATDRRQAGTSNAFIVFSRAGISIDAVAFIGKKVWIVVAGVEKLVGAFLVIRFIENVFFPRQGVQILFR